MIGEREGESEKEEERVGTLKNEGKESSARGLNRLAGGGGRKSKVAAIKIKLISLNN